MEREETKICVKCGEGPKDGDILNQVGRNWFTEKGTANPLNTLNDLAVKSGLTSWNPGLDIINRKKYLLSFTSVVAQN